MAELDPGIVIAMAADRVYHPQIISDRAKVETVMAAEKSERNFIIRPAGELRLTDSTQPDWSQLLLSSEPLTSHDLTLATDLLAGQP